MRDLSALCCMMSLRECCGSRSRVILFLAVAGGVASCRLVEESGRIVAVCSPSSMEDRSGIVLWRLVGQQLCVFAMREPCGVLAF
jgi:hypothetical protein